ncbi:hypothetical protein COB64_03840 [Candidatus Wolfebacteria bacterium]|nr:MAG: hypothetical protein COB64_03840 [Candidatus Wolfebacteria bacterium]
MDLILNIVAGIIVLIIGAVIGKQIERCVKYFVGWRAFARALSFNTNKEIIYAYGSIPPGEKDNKVIVQQGDVYALLVGFQTINTLFDSEKILIQDGGTLGANISLHPNVLSISGPKWNPGTRHLLGKIGAPIKFIKDPKGILVYPSQSQGKERVFEIEREAGQLVKVCYGVIFNGSIRNTSGTEQHVLICCGVTTVSTSACLLYLSSLFKSKDEFKDLKHKGLLKENKWGLLLRVENHTKQDSINDPLQEINVNSFVEKVFYEKDFLTPYVYE